MGIPYRLGEVVDRNGSKKCRATTDDLPSRDWGDSSDVIAGQHLESSDLLPSAWRKLKLPIFVPITPNSISVTLSLLSLNCNAPRSHLLLLQYQLPQYPPPSVTPRL